MTRLLFAFCTICGALARAATPARPEPARDVAFAVDSASLSDCALSAFYSAIKEPPYNVRPTIVGWRVSRQNASRLSTMFCGVRAGADIMNCFGIHLTSLADEGWKVEGGIARAPMMDVVATLTMPPPLDDVVLGPIDLSSCRAQLRN